MNQHNPLPTTPAPVAARPQSHVIAAVLLPLVLAGVYFLLSPVSPFTVQGSLLGNLNSEFVYCNLAVLWFGWRLGGETLLREDLPQRFWTSAAVAFVITLMLYQQAVWATAGSAPTAASRYVTYYLWYVGLAYFIIYLGHLKIGSRKTADGD